MSSAAWAKDYILETTGNGVAIFDYDGDGRNDIFIANGTRLNSKEPSPPQLYHNEGNGHFTMWPQAAGFNVTGWGQAVCVGDFDNDGHPDLLVTYYGHNILYRNRGDGTFEDVTAKAHLPTTGVRYGSGCSFVDYDRDGYLDIVVANYVDLDLDKDTTAGRKRFLLMENIPVMCGPRGLAEGAQHSLSQQSRWNVYGCERSGGIFEAWWPIQLRRGGCRFR